MKKTTLLFLTFLFTYSSFSQNISRTVAVLNTTIRNGETSDGELYSVKHLLKVSGISFIVTTNVDSAVLYPVVLTSSKLQGSTTTTTEKNSLINYVNLGGMLIAPNISDTYLYYLFGISDNFETDTRHLISFDMPLASPAFRWMDDTMEQTISMGRITYAHVNDSRNYTLTTATQMAHFEDGTPAITENLYGSGKAYALGAAHKIMILLPQLDKDEEAQRVWSNGFEPTTDCWMMFIKALCLSKIQNSVWLHTSPYDSKSTLIITHDIDAVTSYDTMHYYADYEYNMGIHATYMCTTHYLADDHMTNYFNPTHIAGIQYVMSLGHKIGSHSMGHFTDFDIDTLCPLGVLGNDTSNYHPYSAIDTTTTTGYLTTGSTVLGETETSKNLLENNLGIPIRSFRAGYLCVNKKLVTALDTLGYIYNTTYSANDVLTDFPYRNHFNRQSSAPLSRVWELPMTISDVFSSNPISYSNWPLKQAIWVDVVNRNTRNYAPTIILIHPTRYYKLFAEQGLINNLPTGVGIYDFETYADYWANRDNITFTTNLQNDTLTVIVPNSLLPLDDKISFVVDNGQNLSLIKAEDDLGNPISAIQSNWDNNGVILHFGYYSPVGSTVSIKEAGDNDLYANCFPNPFNDESTIEVWLKQSSNLNINVYNALGQSVKVVANEKQGIGIHRFQFKAAGLPAGTYFCRIVSDHKSVVKKIMIGN